MTLVKQFIIIALVFVVGVAIGSLTQSQPQSTVVSNSLVASEVCTNNGAVVRVTLIDNEYHVQCHSGIVVLVTK